MPCHHRDTVTVTHPPPLVQVRHPNCVQVIAASLDPSDPFIVMEWVPGGNWFNKLCSDPPPPAHERVRAVREMASALQYLHEPLIGIIHGDIKSLHLLLMRDGRSKVKKRHSFLWVPPDFHPSFTRFCCSFAILVARCRC